MARVRDGVLLVVMALGCSGGGDRSFGSSDAGNPGETGAQTCAAQADCDDHFACTRDTCIVGGVCQHDPDNATCTSPQVCMVGRGCATPGAMTCAAQADCDDHLACTRDTCLVDGTCRHAPQDGSCPAGQTCDLALGCSTMMSMPGTCRADGDCDDRLPCTDDLCGVDGHCTHVAQNARCTAGQVCRAGMGCIVARSCSSDHDCDDGLRCDGTERCTELACLAGAAVSCDDGNPCTLDACVETGAAMCTHTANPMCTGTVRSGIYTVATPPTYACMDDLGMAALDIHITGFQFAVSASMLTVTPIGRGGAAMNGPVPTGTTFSVTGVVAGTCMETYRLTGTFTDATHFTGTFSLSLVGLDCGFTNCVNSSFPVMGTVRM